MRFLISVLLLSFSFEASTETLKVSGILDYTLKFSPQKISFKEHHGNLFLDANQCNKDLLKEFHQKISKFIKFQKDGNFQFKVTASNIKKRPGKLLYAIPQELQRLKIEDSLLCPSKATK